jgi:hypothetical protein
MRILSHSFLPALGATLSLAGATLPAIQDSADASRRSSEVQSSRRTDVHESLEQRINALRGLPNILGAIAKRPSGEQPLLTMEEMTVLLAAQCEGDLILLSPSSGFYLRRGEELFQIKISDDDKASLEKDLRFLKDTLCIQPNAALTSDSLNRALVRYDRIIDLARKSQHPTDYVLAGSAIRNGDILEEVSEQVPLAPIIKDIESLKSDLRKQRVLEPLMKDAPQGPYWCLLGEGLWAAFDLVGKRGGEIELRIFEQAPLSKGVQEVLGARISLTHEQRAKLQAWAYYHSRTSDDRAHNSEQVGLLIGQWVESISFTPLQRSSLSEQEPKAPNIS